MIPIIVRQYKNQIGKYEILSGHNRVKAAEKAKIYEVPAIIKYNLSDDEAKLIVTETNLIQRSFADLSYSEIASAFAVHYEALKNHKKGYKKELLEEIKAMTNTDNTGALNMGGTEFHHEKTRDEAASKYDMTGRNMSNYLRINVLIDPLKELLDNDIIKFKAGVQLSYLKNEEQEELNKVLEKSEYSKFTMNENKAVQMRKVSESDAQNPLSQETIIQILKGENKAKPVKEDLTVIYKSFKKYFSKKDSPETIKKEVSKAVELIKRKVPEKLSDYMSQEEIATLDIDAYVLSLIEKEHGKTDAD